MFSVPPHTMPNLAQSQTQTSFPMPATVFAEVEGLPYVRRIDLHSCLHSLDKTNSGSSMPLTYTEFMQYACKQWGIACSVENLALLEIDASSKSTKAVLITSNAEWNQVWQRYRRKRAPPAFQMTGFAAHAPAPDIPAPTFKILPRPKLPSAFLPKEGSTQAGTTTGTTAPQATPPSSGRHTAASSNTSSPQADTGTRTQALRTDNAAVIGELKTAIRDLAKEVTETVGGSVTRTVRDVVQSALRDAGLVEDGTIPRGSTSSSFSPAVGGVASAGADAAQTLLSVVDRFVAGVGTRAAAHGQGGARSRAAPAPAQTQATTSGSRTPSSSYDNMPPSEPLREETPAPESSQPPAQPASSAQNVGLDNAQVIRNLGGEDVKGKKRDSSTNSTASSSEDWQLEGGATDDSIASQQQAQQAIQDNNVALEDAFNAMLARIRQQ